MGGSDKIFKTLIWSNLEDGQKSDVSGCDPSGTSSLETCMNELSDNNMITDLNTKLSTTLTQMKNKYDEGGNDEQKIKNLVDHITAQKTPESALGDIDIRALSAFKPNHSLPAQRQEYELHSRKINMDSVLWGVISLTFLYFTVKKIRTIGS